MASIYMRELTHEESVKIFEERCDRHLETEMPKRVAIEMEKQRISSFTSLGDYILFTFLATIAGCGVMVLVGLSYKILRWCLS